MDEIRLAVKKQYDILFFSLKFPSQICLELNLKKYPYVEYSIFEAFKLYSLCEILFEDDDWIMLAQPTLPSNRIYFTSEKEKVMFLLAKT